jgi:hypothetical protein
MLETISLFIYIIFDKQSTVSRMGGNSLIGVTAESQMLEKISPF